MTYAEYVRKEYENGSEEPADFEEWYNADEYRK